MHKLRTFIPCDLNFQRTIPWFWPGNRSRVRLVGIRTRCLLVRRCLPIVKVQNRCFCGDKCVGGLGKREQREYVGHRGRTVSRVFGCNMYISESDPCPIECSPPSQVSIIYRFDFPNVMSLIHARRFIYN